MHHSRVMRRFQRRRNLLEYRNGLFRSQFLFLMQKSAQISPLHVLHGDVSDSACLSQIEYADDVAVRNFPRQDEFLFEAPQDLRMTGEVGTNQLQCNQTLQFDVSRLVNRPHPALTEQLKDFVALPEHAPRLKLSFCRHLTRRAHRDGRRPSCCLAIFCRRNRRVRQGERSVALLARSSGGRIIRLANRALHELGDQPPRTTSL